MDGGLTKHTVMETKYMLIDIMEQDKLCSGSSEILQWFENQISFVQPNPQVINVKQSSINMVPSKVEIMLRKGDPVAWGKLEDPNYKPEPEPVEDDFLEAPESNQPDWDIADDDISDSDEEWANDTQQNKTENSSDEQKEKEREQEVQNLKRKEVEEEMKRLMEKQNRVDEERRKLEEQRRQEDQGGYEDMPDLEDGEADLDG